MPSHSADPHDRRPPKELYFVWAVESPDRFAMLAPVVDAAVRETAALFEKVQAGTRFLNLCVGRHLPAPMSDDEWQLVPAPSEGLFSKFRRSPSEGKAGRVQLSSARMKPPGDGSPLFCLDVYRATTAHLRDTPESGYHDQPCIVITDVELKPPDGWRYILSDDCDDGMVISTAAMDPEFWSEREPGRMTTIRRRLRALCCSNVGDIYGVEECRNPRCFFLGWISAVTLLDDMVGVGSEHENTVAGALVHQGFRSKRTPKDTIRDEAVTRVTALVEKA